MSNNLANVFKSLANENRLSIFELIWRKELSSEKKLCCKSMASCVNEITEKFNLAQSTVSHHLKELKNAGLINTKKEKTWVYCSINHDTIQRLKKFFERYEVS